MFYCLAVDGKHNSVVLLLPTQCVIDFKNGERLVYSDVVDWIDSLLIFYLIVVLLQRHILEKDSCSRPTQIHWRFVASKSLVLHGDRYRESRVCTRRAAETTAPFRCAPSARGRATGTSPRARRGRARRRSRCGRRRRRESANALMPGASRV